MSEFNNLLALPPIFRNIEIENIEEVISEYMHSQAQKHSLLMTKKDRKLTTIVYTNGFIITDYKAIPVSEKNTAYEPFVRTMMNLKIQAKFVGSSKEKFQKLIINASYGYDTLNAKKFDCKRFYFVLTDIGSIYIAIAGDPSKDCHQQFESIVTDKQFYDQHVYLHLPDPNKDIYDYKRYLDLELKMKDVNLYHQDLNAVQ
ncbi:MAG: hypothetical protein EZS28_020122 [Streblomastix strix]|uniref:Uncharacterized protein n=1 Tax=Streblomastix strix TaxID=222440 RepID=A0A5J4VP31_9EUKA|nr:MAG: hypothetical protein EZS28_020122 [Streblomastix strix]